MILKRILIVVTFAALVFTACAKNESKEEGTDNAKQSMENTEDTNTGRTLKEDKDTELTKVTEDNFRSFPVSDESIFTIGPVEGGTEIVGCKRDVQDKVIVIPDKISGADVVSIGEGAFTEIENVEAIVLPDTVKTIGLSAFTGCTNLKYVYFGSGLKSTGDMMFNYCNTIEKIELPEGTQKIGGYLATRCSALKEIIVPASVTEINGRMMESFDFNGVIKTPAGSEAEKNAIEAGIKVENY